ncbi:hypothetical protein GCM10027610_126270 [Dactylosporangium cerinum]
MAHTRPSRGRPPSPASRPAILRPAGSGGRQASFAGYDELLVQVYQPPPKWWNDGRTSQPVLSSAVGPPGR